MKRILSLILAAALALSVLALVGCGKKEEALKLGLGVHSTATVTNATEDVAGAGQATMTVAAVLVDENGKIVNRMIRFKNGRATSHFLNTKRSLKGKF